MADNDLAEIPYKMLAALLDSPALLDPPEAIGRIGWRGKVTLLPGHEKSGKSSFIGYDAVEVARQGQKVLWLPFEEDLNQVVQRFANLKALEAGAADHIWIADPCPLSDTDMRDRYIQPLQPDIIYIDTFASYLYSTRRKDSPEMSQNVEWQKFMQEFKAWSQLGRGSAVVVVHHQNKGGKSHGSIGITAGADCIADFNEVSREKDSKLIEFRARFQIPSPFLKIRWDADQFAYVLHESESSGQTHRKPRPGLQLYNLVRESPGITRADAAKHFKVVPGTIDNWCIQMGLEKRDGHLYLPERQ